MVKMDPMENRRKRQRNTDNDGIGYNYTNSSTRLHSTNQGPSGSSPSPSTSPYPYSHSANNSINERFQTGKRLRTESYFMNSSMNNANHQAQPTSYWANNSFSERNSTTNHQRGLRGNYIRPSILDREKNKPYSRILKIRPRRERNDELHIPHMTSTAMKIVESLAKNSSPVVQYGPVKGPPIQFSPSLLQDRAKTFQILGKNSSSPSSSTFPQNVTRASPSFQNQNNSSPFQRNVTPTSSSTQQQQQEGKLQLDLDTHLDDDIKFSEPLTLGRLIKMYKTSKESMKPSSQAQAQDPAFTFNTSMSKDNENDQRRTSATTFDNPTTRNFSPLNKINTSKASVDSPDNKSTSGSSAFFGAPSQYLPTGKPFTFPKSSDWECPSCMVKNKDHILSCACCGESKPGSKKEIQDSSPSTQPFTVAKSSDWECPSCMVNNKDHILSCACCAEPKPGSKKETRDSTPPASSQPFSFGLPVSAVSTTSVNPPASTFSGFAVNVNKGWECSTCMVNNKVDDSSCICCSEPKPGSKNVDKNQNITTSTTPFSFGFGAAAAAAATTTKSSTPPTTPTVAASGDNDKKLSFTSTSSSTTSALPNNFSFGLPSSTSITKPTIPSFSTFDSAKNAGSKTSTSLFPTTTATPSVTPSGFSFGLPASTTISTPAFNSLSEVKDEPKTTITFGNNSIIITTSPTHTTNTFTAPSTAATATSNFSFGLPSSTGGAKRKSSSSSSDVVYPTKTFTLEKPSENLGLFGTPTPPAPAFGQSQDPPQSSLLFSSQPQALQTTKTFNSFNSFPIPAAVTQEQKPNIGSIQTPVFTFGTSAAAAPKENDICQTTFATTATPSFSFGGPSSSTNMNMNSSIRPSVVASAAPAINSFSFGSTSAENTSIFGGMGQGQSHAFGGLQAPAPAQAPPPPYQNQMFNPQAQPTPTAEIQQQNSLFNNNNSFSVPQIPQIQPHLTNNIQPPPSAFNSTPNFNFGALPAQTQQPGASAPLFTFSSTPQGDSNGGSMGERKIKQARRRIR